MLYYCLLFRERYYQKVMGSDSLLFYDRFILIAYEYCNELYDYIYVRKYGGSFFELYVDEKVRNRKDSDFSSTFLSSRDSWNRKVPGSREKEDFAIHSPISDNTDQHFFYSGTPETDWVYKGF